MPSSGPSVLEGVKFRKGKVGERLEPNIFFLSVLVGGGVGVTAHLTICLFAGKSLCRVRVDMRVRVCQLCA